MWGFFFSLFAFSLNGQYDADREVNRGEGGEMASGCDLGQT